MMFCPKCGSILLPKKIDDKTKMSCSCGYSTDEQTKITETIRSKDKLEIIEKNEETLPKTPAECEKCHNTEAYYWLLQTRSGDEPETKFLRCTRCEHTWRDYS